MDTPSVVPSGPAEKSSPDGLEQAQGEAQQRCREAVSEILCDMLIDTVATSGDDPALGGK